MGGEGRGVVNGHIPDRNLSDVSLNIVHAALEEHFSGTIDRIEVKAANSVGERGPIFFDSPKDRYNFTDSYGVRRAHARRSAVDSLSNHFGGSPVRCDACDWTYGQQMFAIPGLQRVDCGLRCGGFRSGANHNASCNCRHGSCRG